MIEKAFIGLFLALISYGANSPGPNFIKCAHSDLNSLSHFFDCFTSLLKAVSFVAFLAFLFSSALSSSKLIHRVSPAYVPSRLERSFFRSYAAKSSLFSALVRVLSVRVEMATELSFCMIVVNS